LASEWRSYSTRGRIPRVIQGARGLLMCGVAVALASPFGRFYHQPQVQWLGIVGALSIGIRGFGSMSVWVMTRRVQLGKVMLVNVIGDASGLIVAVVWALLSPTAWSLVAGKVATALAYVLTSHAISEHLPSLRCDWVAAKEIMKFGTGMFLSSATYFLSGQAERLVIGKFASIADLGCFTLAVSIATVPLLMLQRLLTNVFYPMISESKRSDSAKAARQFRRFRVVLLCASIVLAVGFIILSKGVVRLLLGPAFSATGWMLQLLGVRAGLELFGFAAATMLFAAGTSKYAAAGNTAKLLFLGAGLTVAFTYFSLREAILVLTLSPIAHYLPMLLGLRKHFSTVLRTELACFAIFLVALFLSSIGYTLIR
jgi:O-antigen/teichoic acid export membrane protein